MPDHYVAFGFDESRSNIVEIDALQGLCNMERSRLACVIDAVPIENTIRGVAVLLDLNQDITGAYGVKSARGKKHGVTSLHRDRVHAFCNCPGTQRLFELLARHGPAQTDVDLGATLRCHHVPKLGLCFAA